MRHQVSVWTKRLPYKNGPPKRPTRRLLSSQSMILPSKLILRLLTGPHSSTRGGHALALVCDESLTSVGRIKTEEADGAMSVPP